MAQSRLLDPGYPYMIDCRVKGTSCSAQNERYWVLLKLPKHDNQNQASTTAWSCVDLWIFPVDAPSAHTFSLLRIGSKNEPTIN